MCCCCFSPLKYYGDESSKQSMLLQVCFDHVLDFEVLSMYALMYSANKITRNLLETPLSKMKKYKAEKYRWKVLSTKQLGKKQRVKYNCSATSCHKP